MYNGIQPRMFQTHTKPNEHKNNDFFNLYSDSLSTESFDLSDRNSSSSSGEEARVVPTAYPLIKENKRYDDSMTFNASIDDNNAKLCRYGNDISERIVIGCENDAQIRTDKNLWFRRKKRRRTPKYDKPLASSTMVDSPLQKSPRIRRTLSRKDSGICESISSDNSYCEENGHGPLNDRTFVIRNCNAKDDSLRDETDNMSISVGNKTPLPIVSSIDMTNLVGVNILPADEKTYVNKSFYNKYNGVPRTSTRVMLHLTPKHKGNAHTAGKQRNTTTTTTSTLVLPAVCSLPFTKLLRILTKRRKRKEPVQGMKFYKDYDMTKHKKKVLVERMKRFQNSYINDTNGGGDIQTLADL